MSDEPTGRNLLGLSGSGFQLLEGNLAPYPFLKRMLEIRAAGIHVRAALRFATAVKATFIESWISEVGFIHERAPVRVDEDW